MGASLSLGQIMRTWVWLTAQLVDCSLSYLQSVNIFAGSTYLFTVGWHGPGFQWASCHPNISSFATTCRNPWLFQNATWARFAQPTVCDIANVSASGLALSTDNFDAEFVNGVHVSFLQKHNKVLGPAWCQHLYCYWINVKCTPSRHFYTFLHKTNCLDYKHKETSVNCGRISHSETNPFVKLCGWAGHLWGTDQNLLTQCCQIWPHPRRALLLHLQKWGPWCGTPGNMAMHKEICYMHRIEIWCLGPWASCDILCDNNPSAQSEVGDWVNTKSHRFTLSTGYIAVSFQIPASSG